MIHLNKRIESIFDKLVVREENPINQARIKMLAYILVLYIFFTGILIIPYSLEGETLHLIRVSIIFVFAILSVAVVRYTKSWKIISHAVLWLITFSVWSNLFIYVQGINVATLQYVWFACALGFYMHGSKWGWFYSIINVLPIFAYTVLDKDYFFFNSGPQEVDHYTYTFVIFYDFALILFLHYYFFRAFSHNFINLTKTKNELNELNDKLKVMLVDVEKLSSARMDFLSSMSHELRTPMNGVIGISNALLLQDPREDQKENLAVLKFSAENLLSLINDILDFNKLDFDKVDLENVPFDLVQLIENSYASLKLKAGEKMLDFRLCIDEDLKDKVVISDPTRLTQVVLNLLNNAIKFTDKGYVSLSAEVISSTNDTMTVLFVIEDTGIGIEQDRHKDIFEAFIQASSSINRYYGGTGLGLPIVKKVLTMFKSRIDMVSTPHLGTKFSFHIDLNYQNATEIRFNQSSDLTPQINHLKILVAEDNSVNILVIKKTLERWGIVPVIAENGLVVLQKLEEDDFDMILMDLYMPEMDGYEAAVAIRKMTNRTKASIPIIAFTASVNQDVAKKVFETGMNDYLAKPFTPEHLFKKITAAAEIKI